MGTPIVQAMEDSQRWRAWIAGDEAAGDQLIRKYLPVVRGYFLRKVGKTGDTADELTQRTFLTAVQKRDGFHPGGNIRAYLLGIARLELLHHAEGRGAGIRGDRLPEQTYPTHVPSPGTVIHLRREHARMRRAIAHIPKSHRTVLELFYWDELGVNEIARVLDVAQGTVKSRLARAREALRVEVMRG